MEKPIVASYCTTFLKPEMLHIYRQVGALQTIARGKFPQEFSHGEFGFGVARFDRAHDGGAFRGGGLCRPPQARRA